MVPRREALLGSTFETRNSLVAPAGDRIGNDELGIAIHLGGVDMGHAEIDAALQRRDRALAVAAVEIPGALPDHGDLRGRLAEGFCVACRTLMHLRHADIGDQHRAGRRIP